MNIFLYFLKYILVDNSFIKDLTVEISGAFIGGLIGAGAAIALYITQTKYQKNKEERAEYEFQSNKLLYLHSLIDKILPTTEQLITAIDNFVIESKKNLHRIEALPIVQIQHFNRVVNVINQEDHFHSYVALIKDKSILNIFSDVDFMYSIIIDFEASYKAAASFDYERHLSYAATVKEVLGLLVNFHAELNKLHGVNNQYFKLVDSLLIMHIQALSPDPSNLSNINDNFLIPMLIQIVPHKNIKGFHDIAHKASDAVKIMTSINANNNLYLDEVKIKNDKLLNSKNKLKIESDKLTHFINDTKNTTQLN